MIKLSLFLISLIFITLLSLFYLPKTTLAAISGSCSPSTSSVAPGTSVRWTVNTSGGTSPWNFTWSGTGGLTRSNLNKTSASDSVDIAYSTTGTHTASVNVFSNGQAKSITCSPLTVTSGGSNNGNSTLGGSCAAYANSGSNTPLSTINSGETVTWKFTPSSGSQPTAYTWSGSDGLTGNSSMVSNTYYNTNSGIKLATASVLIFASGSSKTIACSNLTVTGNGGNPNTSNPTSTPSTNNTNLNFRATPASNCTNGNRAVSLSWRAISGAVKYSITRDGPNIGDDIKALAFTDTVSVAGNHTYILYAHNNIGQIISQAQQAVNIQGCQSSAPTSIPHSNQTPPPGQFTPTPTSNQNQNNQPTHFKVANASSPNNCASALSSVTEQSFIPNSGSDLTLSWDLLNGDANQSNLKTVCAQFKINGIWQAPFYSQINLNSSSQPNPTSTPSDTENPRPTSGSTSQPQNTSTPQPTNSSSNPQNPTPTPKSNSPRTTVSYRTAEKISEIADAPWQPYTGTPMNLTYTFSENNFGPKQFCAQFLASDGTASSPQCQNLLYVEDPIITGCELKTADASSVTMEITGSGFGSTPGFVDNDKKLQTVISWSDKKVVAKYLNPSVGESLVIFVTTSEYRYTKGLCSSVSQLSLSARVFCPQVKPVDIVNVELTLKNLEDSSTPIKESVSITKDGLVMGLKTKLIEGKKYQVSLKVPKGIRKSAEIMAEKGTTNVIFTTPDQNQLPLGDIFPTAGGDGTINTLDKTQLNREWVTSTGATRTGDLNGDGRVNSFDWACMKQDFGAQDSNLP